MRVEGGPGGGEARVEGRPGGGGAWVEGGPGGGEGRLEGGPGGGEARVEGGPGGGEVRVEGGPGSLISSDEYEDTARKRQRRQLKVTKMHQRGASERVPGHCKERPFSDTTTGWA